jgi:hypothetical protein
MIVMMKRRTLLTALPFAFLAACSRAQAGQQSGAPASDISKQALLDLTGGVGKIVWLSLAGTVRLTAGNADVRSASLYRAVRLGADGISVRLFDVWQVTGDAVVAGPSIASDDSGAETTANDAGVDSFWLSRSFTLAGLQAPFEHSRLSREGARVIAIDATQIWLLEGGIAATPPPLADAMLVAFEAWKAAS